MADIEEEIDFSKFGTSSNRDSTKKSQPIKNDGAVMMELPQGAVNKDRQSMIIYLVAIVMLSIAMFIEWRYFLSTPKPPTTATEEELKQMQPNSLLSK